MKVSRKLDINDINTNHIYKSMIDDHRSAKNLLRDTEIRVKELCEQAQSDYEDELAKAYKEGMRLASEKWMKNKLLHSKRSIEHLIGIEDKLADIAEQAIRKIIGDFDQTTLLTRTIKNLLNGINRKNAITLHVNPKSLEEIKKYFQNEEFDYIKIIGNAEISDTNAFTINTPSGKIESNISTQVDDVIKVMREIF